MLDVISDYMGIDRRKGLNHLFLEDAYKDKRTLDLLERRSSLIEFAKNIFSSTFTRSWGWGIFNYIPRAIIELRALVRPLLPVFQQGNQAEVIKAANEIQQFLIKKVTGSAQLDKESYTLFEKFIGELKKLMEPRIRLAHVR